MRRKYWVVVANVAALALVVSCRDSIVQPSLAPSGAPVSMLAAPAGRPTLSLRADAPSAATADFVVTREGGVFLIGRHAVVFPANSICNSASGYGAAFWDAPCTPTNAATKVHAEVTVSGGRTTVDFSPAIRFAPSSDARGQVWLFIQNPAVIGASGDLSRFNILYEPAKGAALVDEAQADPTLRTYVDTQSGVSARVLKHFSGYTVAGRSCDTADPACTDTTTP